MKKTPLPKPKREVITDNSKLVNPESRQHPKLGRIPIGASLEKVNFTVPSPWMSMAELAKQPKPLKAVCFFSGMGGASLGMKQAGFNVLYANEFVPIAAETYRVNAPGTFVDTRDIRTVTGKDVLAKIKLKRGELDLMGFSPPCKLFSSAQAYKKGRELGKVINYSEGIHQRVDDLFFEGARILKELQPKVFFAENVEGLTKDVNRGVLLEVFEALRACGYHVEARLIDAARLGIPQRRVRTIFLGIRKDLVPKVAKGEKYKFPWPKPDPYETSVADILPHIVKIKKASGFQHARQPYDTITASCHSIGFLGQFSRGGFVETVDGRVRRFTIEELKRMNGFPDDFKMVGTWIQRWERLGRCLVPEVYRRLGMAVRAELFKGAKRGR